MAAPNHSSAYAELATAKQELVPHICGTSFVYAEPLLHRPSVYAELMRNYAALCGIMQKCAELWRVCGWGVVRDEV